MSVEERTQALGDFTRCHEVDGHDNHVINWPVSTILDRESDESTRWIKEAVHIRKEGRQSLNRDEGSYTLSHMYDQFLAMSHHYLRVVAVATNFRTKIGIDWLCVNNRD